jgi:O-antigen/teichoic acid export membrane protein
MVTQSMTSVLISDFATLYRNGQRTEIVRLIHRAIVKSGMVLIPAMFFLLCTAPECMRLLFGTAYVDSAHPFRIYLLLLPVRTLTFGAVFMATGNTRHVLIQSALFFLVNSLLMVPAIHLFGANAAASSTVLVTYLLVVPYYLIQMRRILGCELWSLLPWAALAKLSTAGLVGAMVTVLVKQLLGDARPFVVLSFTASTCLAVVIALLSYWRFMNIRTHLARAQRAISRGINRTQ